MGIDEKAATLHWDRPAFHLRKQARGIQVREASKDSIDAKRKAAWQNRLATCEKGQYVSAHAHAQCHGKRTLE